MPLAAIIRDLILRDGPLTFRDFMDAALHHPQLGYYNTERIKIGRRGDYVTSSNVHSVFGTILARALANMLGEQGAAMGAESCGSFEIIEVGAGTGRLAADILAALARETPDIYHRLRYRIIDKSPAMIRRQHEVLGGFEGRVDWTPLDAMAHQWPGPGSICAVVFSNELIDAMPVHVVRFSAGALEELWVRLRPESADSPAFGFEWRQPSTPRLREYLERCGAGLVQGQIAEVNLDAVDWVAGIAQSTSARFLVTIDYGDLAGDLYSPGRRLGTLRGFRRHALAVSVLDNAGEQDLTASVNFTALIEYGRDAGFDLVSHESQAAFLMRMGILDYLAGSIESSAGGGPDLKERLAIKNLIAPGGMSDNFRVLIQRRR